MRLGYAFERAHTAHRSAYVVNRFRPEEGTRYRKFIHQRRQDNPNPIPRPRLTTSQLDWQEWEAEQSLRLCISDPGYILWTQAKIDFLEELRECVMGECRAIYGQVFPEGHTKAGEDMPGNDCHPEGLTLPNDRVPVVMSTPSPSPGSKRTRTKSTPSRARVATEYRRQMSMPVVHTETPCNTCFRVSVANWFAAHKSAGFPVPFAFHCKQDTDQSRKCVGCFKSKGNCIQLPVGLTGHRFELLTVLT
ncbi:uncharacterized protein N7529_012158 [Penicillium soppii]|uniref:uncharacterized protein n=1 Tax=Penicillium soppii TaxID=69789 RepID=UPI002546922E|nr:uncharacterized protein N7529_012158 [Penicillium soppii]KAJ5852773.1 hypothetical protein N7529_012158 [Penicillium soppii]